MENEPADEMAALYRSFSSALTEHGDLLDFSKDDLLDIYDYSRSVPDDYVANEVIAVGLRRFPDCKDFIKRKALLFHDLGHDDLCETILSLLPDNAFTRRMAQLKNEIVMLGREPDFKEEFKQYQKGSVEDGDLIYMVDIFDSIGRWDILELNAEEISEISQFPSTIFSELYSLSLDNAQYEKARRFGHRLTEVEPFNVSGWTELANLYLTRIGDQDAALECSEFALAVSPDDVGAKMIKALIIYDKDEALTYEMINDALSENEDDPRALYVAACVDFHKKNYSGGIEKIIRSLPGFSFGQRREAVDLVLRSIVGPLDPEIRGALGEVLLVDSEIRYETWIMELVERKCFVGAYELALIAIKNQRFEPKTLAEVSAVLDTMYSLGRYEEMSRFVIQDLTDEDILNLPPFYALVYAIALFRMGRTEQLLQWMSRYGGLNGGVLTGVGSQSIDSRLLSESIIQRLELMRKYILGDTSIAESSFDPFLKPVVG